MLQEVNNIKHIASSSPRAPVLSQGAMQEASHRVVRRYRKAQLRKIQRKEYLKLRAIVPAVASQGKVSKVTVIEEAIKYIDELHRALADRLQQGQLSPPPQHTGQSSFLPCQPAHQSSAYYCSVSPLQSRNNGSRSNPADNPRHYGGPSTPPHASSYHCNTSTLPSPLQAVNRIS